MNTFKHSFKNDYSELAHPRVLAALASVGTKQFEGYGLDEYSSKAAEHIKKKIGKPSADVHFISGGTHANLTVIASALRPYEAVIACESGHISTHETGAIETAGHKICTVRGENGKLNAADIEAVVDAHADEHMVKPRLVYISQSTEVGTVYKKAELKEIAECCQRNGLYLFADGARLGAGMNSHACDLTYSDIADMVDAFFVGGTKIGALFGEAIVICRDELKTDFRYNLKQRGALLSKGASIGVQFVALFEDGLYDELAKHANDTALKIAEGIKGLGYDFLSDAETNQIFPIFPSEVAEKLHGLYGFYDWQRMGDMTAVRLVCSWATPDSIIEEFIGDLSTI
ncbi:MAG: aminotransferase class V-fold PLP-dependent enzyme [Clostridiales bacterium]|nr:aminotransferase class V-fold PLP-dependent enzyme [Clostridiales bacterium]